MFCLYFTMEAAAPAPKRCIDLTLENAAPPPKKQRNWVKGMMLAENAEFFAHWDLDPTQDSQVMWEPENIDPVPNLEVPREKEGEVPEHQPELN